LRYLGNGLDLKLTDKPKFEIPLTKKEPSVMESSFSYSCLFTDHRRHADEILQLDLPAVELGDLNL
jgi:hypothetical protein